MPAQEKFGNSGFFNLKKLSQDRRVIVFLGCLAISTFLWFLNALSKDYETTLVYPVKYTNLPDKRFLANDPPANLELTIQAHGFVLLKNKLKMKLEPIVLDVGRLVATSETSDKMTYMVRTANLENRILSQLPDEINILEIRPGSFVLTLDNLRSKLVKVEPNLRVDFAPQYNISSEAKVSPEYVTLYGPAALLDTIEAIYTQPFKSEKIKSPVDAMVGLLSSEKITPSPKEVRIIIPVEEFTEKKLAIPITVTGKPVNISVKLFPSEVQVSFMVGLSKYTQVNISDFEVTIPFSELKDGIPNVPVNLGKRPDFIDDLKFSPKSVEFLIEK